MTPPSYHGGARFGVVVLGMAGVWLLADPAWARAATDGDARGPGADLGLSITGTTVSVGSPGKESNVTIVNNGPATASGVVVTFDVSRVDTGRVALRPPFADSCRTVDGTMSCDVVDIERGQALDLAATIVRHGDAGPAGQLTATVSHGGLDANPVNNSVSAALTVAASGPDLYAYAPDASFDPDTGTTTEVAPGARTALRYAVGNHGDVAASGLRIRIRLPRYVSFAAVLPECRYGPDPYRAVCTLHDASVTPAPPAGSDRSGTDSLNLQHPVRVSPDAPSPGRLGGGEVLVEPIAALGDVDGADNLDEFVVYVAGPTGYSGTLPTTGGRHAGALGVAFSAIFGGAMLILLSRRGRSRETTPATTTQLPTACRSSI